MKTSDVKAAIRRHYSPNEYALMFEVGNATGARVKRHADAIAVNLWPSRGLLIEGIEIKVSRSDWRRELENPAKAEEIARYCDKWWVIAPTGIVQQHEVPVTWGLKEVNDKGALRVVKDAPKSDNVSALDRGFVAAMLRRASEADAAEIKSLVDKEVLIERERIAQKVEKEVERRTQAFEAVEEKLKALKESGLDLMNGWESASEIIRSYKLGKGLIKNYHLTGLEHTAERLSEAAKQILAVNEILTAEQASA